MKRIIAHTADGSATLFVPELDEHYHSVKGARTESQHIFVDMGLRCSTVPSPSVLEIGFGTGLNAYLTLLAAQHDRRKVHYTGFERYPLDADTVKAMQYTSDSLFDALHSSPWEMEVDIDPCFTLLKRELDFTQYAAPAQSSTYDVIYFDAFAPEKQPDMWTPDRFALLYDSLNEGGILTTYCAKGSIRRMLQEVGFTMERLQGPPGGKREILRGTKKND